MLSPDSDPFGHLSQSILSYDGNIMLAAIISLLLVILFVLLLHVVYAKWFLAQARHRRSSSVSVSQVLGPARFHTFTVNTTFWTSPAKGLDSSAIASIPLFVYKSDDEHNNKHGLECVICLSMFEDEEVGRLVPKCGHAFHVECIDMWLHSHSNCPICRAPVAVVVSSDHQKKNGNEDIVSIPNDHMINIMISSDEQQRGQLMASDELCVINAADSTILEIMVENENENENVAICDSCSSSLGGSRSLKRMLSRNGSESKLLPSFIVNESSED